MDRGEDAVSFRWVDDAMHWEGVRLRLEYAPMSPRTSVLSMYRICLGGRHDQESYWSVKYVRGKFNRVEVVRTEFVTRGSLNDSDDEHEHEVASAGSHCTGRTNLFQHRDGVIDSIYKEVASCHRRCIHRRSLGQTVPVA